MDKLSITIFVIRYEMEVVNWLGRHATHERYCVVPYVCVYVYACVVCVCVCVCMCVCVCPYTNVERFLIYCLTSRVDKFQHSLLWWLAKSKYPWHQLRLCDVRIISEFSLTSCSVCYMCTHLGFHDDWLVFSEESIHCTVAIFNVRYSSKRPMIKIMS